MIDGVSRGKAHDPDQRPSSGQPVPELPAWKAFVVQFSREAGSFAGRVEHLSSGRRSRFNSAAELVATLETLLDEIGASSESGGADD